MPGLLLRGVVAQEGGDTAAGAGNSANKAANQRRFDHDLPVAHKFLPLDMLTANLLLFQFHGLIDVFTLDQNLSDREKGDQGGNRGDTALHRGGAKGQPGSAVDGVQADHRQS